MSSGGGMRISSKISSNSTGEGGAMRRAAAAAGAREAKRRRECEQREEQGGREARGPPLTGGTWGCFFSTFFKLPKCSLLHYCITVFGLLVATSHCIPVYL